MRFTLFPIVAAAGLLVGCGGGGDDDNDVIESEMFTYNVSIRNVSNNQPLAPAGVVMHESGYSPWSVGASASAGIEMLAESGSPADWLAAALGSSAVMATAVGTGVVGPGGSETIAVVVESDQLHLSLASMPVNTNDAFAGANSVSVAGLAAGESMSLYLNTYDAGTEANTESAGTVPGPAGGGEGFNAARDDLNVVTIHSGVVTQSDGLSSSALLESHRFIGPVAKVVVTRIQ